MISWIKANLKAVVVMAALAALVVIVLGISRYLANKNRQIAELITRLATSEQTVEVERGLYAKKSAEVTDLKDLLSKVGEENTKLSELVRKGQMEVLALNQLVVRWKGAYEAAVEAHQTEEPPVDPGGIVRKRVDFEGAVGPFLVMGHTWTDPPASVVSITQTKPLRLTIALTKNRDGTFSTLVTSDDEDVETDIRVSAIDPTVLRPKWYQRFWLQGSAHFLGDDSASLGLSYQFDRWSLGASCAYGTGLGCGLTAGYRLFR